MKIQPVVINSFRAYPQFSRQNIQSDAQYNVGLPDFNTAQAILARNNINFCQTNDVFIPNIKEIHINKSENDVYLENIYPVPIKSFRDKKICEYLSLLMIFTKAPYISEDSGLINIHDLKDNNIKNGTNFLKFQFTPTGDENIKNTDNAILVFQGILNSLYDDNIDNTLIAIQKREKEFIQEEIRNNKDKSLKNINIPELYKTIDSIKTDDIKEFLSKYIISQPPVVYINEEKNPYKNN